MSDWTKETLSNKPERYQSIGPGLYMERRNIVEKVDPETGEKQWECESREVTSIPYSEPTVESTFLTDENGNEYKQVIGTDGVARLVLVKSHTGELFE